ncbi:hypothetical protein DOTSEDRAFT_69951 [Dothistroma septosporum NZE10]|uniref:Nucleotide exchange factor Fes1 domain-containing protein n=1 Tax=Dothistroma septosporum (strain NZE10 / CBS 128990) TaxID=675120 RepID=N1Q0N3_DOTSN|nr:hypothetical protein DOTSEDRAFT_69951 [Dothistroma septosporum NZE10]
MAGQKESLNQLLQWSTENSVNDGQKRDPTQGITQEMINELMGGPSDADRMRDAMTAIVAPTDQIDLGNKLIAWDNFEQLIENIDNANNMEPMGLWAPVIQQLDNQEPQMRRHAAACCSTAVQNNIKSQEKLLSMGAVPKLAKLAVEDSNLAVRKKAISALSSTVRNFQPGMDELEKSLPDSVWTRKQGIDAADMEACDEVIQKLRDNSTARG